MMAPKLPPHDPARLRSVSEIKLAVRIDLWRFPFWEGHTRMGAFVPEWSAEARDQVIGAVAKTFATDGLVVRHSDARLPVPWRPGRHALVEPLAIPDCEAREDAAATSARLEVVAIQTVKTAGQRVFSVIASLIDPAFWLMLPVMPIWLTAHAVGAGNTAIRFCLYEAGSPAPAWAYGEWDHGGLDLRDPANVEQLVGRALEHYRAALAKGSVKAPTDK